MAPFEGVHEKRTCVVCDELKPLSNFPTPFELSPHDHQHDICRECFSNHLEVEVDNKTWDQISCPQCPVILQSEEIKNLASPESWAKYEHFSARAALSEMPDYRFCFSTSCDSGQIHEEGLVFSCKACGHKHCTACEVNWHEDETCEEYQTRNAAQKQQEQDSEAQVHAISKTCPNCATKIEKRDGCDHMTCSRCHYQFCWACLADFMPIARHGLHRHETSCRNHRPEGHLGTEEEDDGLMPWAQRPDAEERLNAALQIWMDLMQILQGLPAQQPRN
ncbi:unnamed protein product [Aureobasidium mustum]|uniref:RING-type domain-containing protein n=1 Tax=Aureobasidium mustum TaxID=2773714 RepID=A0A9N8PKA7_9PEZI|nr:unnamed protein product [Aureobasidium mustum]